MISDFEAEADEILLWVAVARVRDDTCEEARTETLLGRTQAVGRLVQPWRLMKRGIQVGPRRLEGVFLIAPEDWHDWK